MVVCEVSHSLSSNPDSRQAAPKSVPEVSYFHELPVPRSKLVSIGVGVGKLIVAGVPPIWILAAQFSGGALAVMGLIFASEAPPPSEATGHSLPSSYCNPSINRPLRSNSSKPSPPLDKLPTYGPNTPVSPVAASVAAGSLAISRYSPARRNVPSSNVYSTPSANDQREMSMSVESWLCNSIHSISG